MTERRSSLNFIFRSLVLAILILGNAAGAQEVILHLRNGDRIAGKIIFESTNELKLSTVWSKEVTVPVSQIERRETTSAAKAEAGAGKTIVTTNAEVFVTAVNTNIAKTNVVAVVPWFKQWKGEVSVGVDYARGATDRELYYTKDTLTYSHPYASDPKLFFRNIFNYTAEYGKTAGVLSANDMGGSSKTDFDVNPRVYVYNLGAASYDLIRKIDLHYEDGPGAGYHLFKGTNFNLNAEAGANYQVEYRSDNTSTHDVYYRLAEDAALKVNKQMNFTEKFEFFPRATNLGQYRLRFESNLSYALLLNLSLNLTTIDFYDTQPATGVPPNDFQLRTSLGMKF